MKIHRILAEKGADVRTVRPATDATIAATVLKSNNIAALVVTDADDHVIGLFGEREIVAGVVGGSGSIEGRRVEQLMTRHPTTCHPDDDITDVMATMTRQRCRHLPVVADGRLRGIVSIGDMVKFRLREIELESQVLRDAYVARR